MDTHLQSLMTSRYVVGFPEQRLAYLAQRIEDEAADYCVVLKPRTQRYLGLLRIADVASAVGSDQRILVDLLERDSHVDVPPDATHATIERLVGTHGAVPVVAEDGEFLGLITEQSYADWALKNERRRSRALEKILEDQRDDRGDVLPFPPPSQTDDDVASDRSG